MDYRRAWCHEGTYFFTVDLHQRCGNDLLVRHIDLLKQNIRQVKQDHPLVIHGLVKRVIDWLHSTFHRLMNAGVYPNNRAGGEEELLSYHD
jgi:REP element-mobilizing transposase RayT